MKTDGPGLAAVGIGAVLIYAGIKGYSAWAVATNLITGKPIATNVALTSPLLSPESASLPTSETGTQTFGTTNKGLAQSMAAARGWTGDHWTTLEKLWNQESSFNNHAKNPKSGAYGIPQALPYTKMPQAAWPESAGGTSDPTAQIQWGLDYIAGRYLTPVMAWAHEQSNGWY